MMMEMQSSMALMNAGGVEVIKSMGYLVMHSWLRCSVFSKGNNFPSKANATCNLENIFIKILEIN